MCPHGGWEHPRAVAVVADMTFGAGGDDLGVARALQLGKMESHSVGTMLSELECTELRWF